jgi:hypothetical protein
MKKLMVILFTMLLVFGVVGMASADLIANYSFTGNANDESGNGNDGTVYGATLTEDRFGNSNSAYSFDGTNDFIEIPFSEDFNFTGELSISFWLKREENQAGNYYKSYIFSRATDRNPDPVLPDWSWFVIELYDNGRIDWSDDTYTMTPLQEWTHYVFIRDNNELSIYENGIREVTADVYWAGWGISSQPLYIGAVSSLSTKNYNGELDDTNIFNQALSDSEVLGIYNSPNPVPEPATMLLLGSGLAGLVGFRKRFRKK